MERDTLLVVVGAGGSYACVDTGSRTIGSEGLPPMTLDDVRPPLTQTLVGPGRLQDEILARYPEARPLVAELRAALAEAGPEPIQSFEALLGSYERSAEENPARDRHLVALRFYLRDLLWACTDYATRPTHGSGLTAYHRLVNELRHWAVRHGRHVCFVNFNYDLILETACRDVFGFDPDDIDGFARDRYVSVVKPHGSVNWAWLVEDVVSARPERDIIARADKPIEVRRDTLHAVRGAPHHRGQARSRPVIPALALPVPDKQHFVWPADQHRFVAERLKTNVRAVLTLGWRGLEPHFLRLLPYLVRSARAVLVTGGPNGVATAEQLQASLATHGDYTDLRVEPNGLPSSLTPYLEWIDEGLA